MYTFRRTQIVQLECMEYETIGTELTTFTQPYPPYEIFKLYPTPPMGFFNPELR